MPHSRQIFVIADDNGKILGAAIPQPSERGEPASRVAALPGQTLHQLEIPAELLQAEQHEILRGIFAYRIQRGSDSSPQLERAGESESPTRKVKS
jgi:hypothetical protein